MAEIGAELHTQYLLTFTPRRGGARRFHQIRILIPNRPDLAVRSRAGYWSVTE
jgi:hypothetical protein